MNTQFASEERRAPGQQALPRNLSVRFEPDAPELAAAEARLMGHWIRHWLPRDPEALVMMACSAPAGRAVRQQRLRALSGLLASHGVAGERVRYTDELVETDNSGAPAGEPGACTVQLKMVNARWAAGQVRSIRSFFEPSRSEKGEACTSAS